MLLCPYLNFDGRAEEALTFYARTLGGKVAFMLRYGESPMAAETPDAQKNHIMHGQVEFGGQVLMGADAPPQWGRTPQGFAVQLSLDSVAEAERVFAALAEGGEVRMPMAETFWAERFGMCTDRWGTPWLINGPSRM